MRKYLLLIEIAVLCAVVTILFTSCGSTPAATEVSTVVEQDELDISIREAADYLNERIPAGNKAVFLNIQSDYPDLSDYILSDLARHAVNDGVFSVVDRQQLDAIRSELNFQYSGEVSDSSAQQVGEMLGAQTIVSGSVRKIGSMYRLDVKAIEVQTAGVQGLWSRNIPNGEITAVLTENMVVASTMPAAAKSLAASAGTAVAVEIVPDAPEVIYKIGDTGPAGGLIFYDKGNNTDGWRYLEAAPADIDRKLVYTSQYFDIIGASERVVGKGKANTEAIMKEAANQDGGFGWAAQACDAYSVNGFSDWFLPSKDELNWMYGNLYMQGLGDFKDDIYWSSTQGNFTGTQAWYQWFSTGQVGGRQVSGQKNTPCYVRAIRAF